MAPIPRSRSLQLAALSERGLNALVMLFWLEAATTSLAGDSAAVARLGRCHVSGRGDRIPHKRASGAMGRKDGLGATRAVITYEAYGIETRSDNGVHGLGTESTGEITTCGAP